MIKIKNFELFQVKTCQSNCYLFVWMRICFCCFLYSLFLFKFLSFLSLVFLVLVTPILMLFLHLGFYFYLIPSKTVMKMCFNGAIQWHVLFTDILYCCKLTFTLLHLVRIQFEWNIDSPNRRSHRSFFKSNLNQIFRESSFFCHYFTALLSN